MSLPLRALWLLTSSLLIAACGGGGGVGDDRHQPPDGGGNGAADGGDPGAPDGGDVLPPDGGGNGDPDGGGNGDPDGGSIGDPDGGPDAPIVPPPTGVAWRWENPRPHGLAGLAIWGSGRGEIWLGGTRGALSRFGQGEWVQHDSHMRIPINSVTGLWGSAHDDVWAATQSEMLHWDGERWRSVVDLGANGVWGFGPDDVWAAGFHQAQILHYDGAAWTAREDVPFVTEYYEAVWGSAPDDVWFVGWYGRISRWNGATFTTESVGGGDLFTVWGSGPDDVWAGGEDGRMLRYDGRRWTDFATGSDAAVIDLWGSGPEDVWAVGAAGTVLHFDGDVWTPIPSGSEAGLYAVWGSGPNDVWIAGDAGVVLRWDGRRLRGAPSGHLGDLDSVWATPAGDVWAAGGLHLLRRTPEGAWRPQAAPAGLAMRDVWISPAGTLWTVGDTGGAARSDGAVWTRVDADTNAPLLAIHGTSDADVWAVGGRGIILRLAGGAWRIERGETFGAVRDVWARAADDVWAVGNAEIRELGQSYDVPLIQRFDGAAWRDVEPRPPVGLLFSVWATAGAVWVGGEDGAARFDGNTWTQPDAGAAPERNVLAIWGEAADSVWAATSSGAIHHWNGAEWTVSPTASDDALVAIHGNAGGAWAVGEGGAILRHGDYEPPPPPAAAQTVGRPCVRDADCGAGGLCLDALPGGYCSADCADAPCAEGACWRLGNLGARCLRGCEATADCDRADGYRCDVLRSCSPPPPAAPRCGDGACNGDERCDTCERDCGACTCTRDCAGRTCGDDGCGGSCGTCGAGASCTLEGRCVAGCVDGCGASWQVAAALPEPREGASAIALSDGRVLLVAGAIEVEGELIPEDTPTCLIYDPAADRWTPTGSLTGDYYYEAPRLFRLPSGKILSLEHSYQSAELYDPAAGTWREIDRTGRTDSDPAIAQLPGGDVLACGGGQVVGSGTTAECERFDAASETFVAAGALSRGREGAFAAALAGGRVLVVGGDSTDSRVSAEIYDPGSGTSQLVDPPGHRHLGGRLIATADGRALLVGGEHAGDPVATAEIFDPATGRWRPTGGLHAARSDFAAHALPDGRVVVAGGADDEYESYGVVEIWDPDTGRFTQAAPLPSPRGGAASALLADGRVLVAGGSEGFDGVATAAIVQTGGLCALDPAGACACFPSDDAAACGASETVACGPLPFTDDCGTRRSADCGECAAGNTCGGAGLAGRCGRTHRGGWRITALDSYVSGGPAPGLMLQPDGEPLVIYPNRMGTGLDPSWLRITRREGARWHGMHLEQVSGTYDDFRRTDAVVQPGPDGLPVLSWFNDRDRGIVVGWRHTAHWERVRGFATPANTFIDDHDHVVDAQGRIHLCAQVHPSSGAIVNGGRIECVHGAGRDGSTTSRVVDTGAGGALGLAIAGDGTLHAAWYDITGGELKYARRPAAGGAWAVASIDAEGTAGLSVDIAVDAAGRPHIAYYVGGDDDDLRYARFDGAAWHTEDVETAGDVGATAALTIDSQGHAHILHVRQGESGGELLHTRRSGAGWTTAVIDTGYDFWAGNIRVAPGGAVHITYNSSSFGTDARYGVLEPPER